MPRLRMSFEVVRAVLQGRKDQRGLFEEMVGFASGTTSLKNVHIMNDLAQTVCGGAPDEAGDLLCRIIREGFEDDRYDNSEAALRRDPRFGNAFERAYPVMLGTEQVRRLRLAARALLNVDGGMYAAGDQMASSVATNSALLGAEGFRRFRIGAFISSVLDEAGRQRIKELYSTDTDPVSRTLRPIFQQGPLVDRAPRRSGKSSLTPLDRALGESLGVLLSQPLSKPLLLRYLALASCMALILKIYGAGREAGRPALLALPSQSEGASRPLREKAVLSLRRGVAEFDHALSKRIAEVSDAALWRPAKPGEAVVEVPEGDRLKSSTELVEALRGARSGGDDEEGKIYWPQDFAASLGRRAGFILPKDVRAGWGNYLALSPEAVEVLVLMFVPHGQQIGWRTLWARVRDELGLVIGANQPEDAALLDQVGVPNVSLQDLSDNAMALLEQSVRRGVARYLPDSGAEVGVYE
jgi:hypothetical protein